MLSEQKNQSEASVEPIESAGVEAVAPIPIPEYVNELVTRARLISGRLTLGSSMGNGCWVMGLDERVSSSINSAIFKRERW